jgi:hypothetical protein
MDHFLAFSVMRPDRSCVPNDEPRQRVCTCRLAPKEGAFNANHVDDLRTIQHVAGGQFLVTGAPVQS